MVRVINDIHPNLGAGKAQARADAMNSAFDDACVLGWEHLVDAVHLPDPGDRHVVAAAHAGRADVIVTANLRDFPTAVLAPMALEAQSPDEFLLNQLDLDPERTIAVLHDQAQAAGNPPLAVEDVLEHLDRAGASTFAENSAHQLWRGALQAE